jgi:hypothetical protein
MVTLRSDTLSIQEAAALAVRAGFPRDQVVTAVAVAMAESGLRPRAKNDNAGTGDYSIGLWQINMRAHKTRFGTEEQLKNPATNARAAYTIWKERNGGSWAPWGAFTNGSYQSHVPTVKAALAASGGPQLLAGIDLDDAREILDEAGRVFTGNPGGVDDGAGVVGDVFNLDGIFQQILSVGLSIIFTTAALALIALGLFRLTGTDAGTIFKAGSAATGAGGALKAIT